MIRADGNMLINGSEKAFIAVYCFKKIFCLFLQLFINKY